MATSESGQPAGGERASSTSTASESPYRKFEEIHGSYASGLHDNWMAAHGRLTEAKRNYLQRLHDGQLELQKEVQDACHKYAKAVADAASAENSADLRASAHREHVEALNAALVSAWRRSEEIKREYRESVEAAQSDYSRGNDTAYRSFLRDLQGAWAGVDPGSLDVQHLNLISHLLLAAAHTAHSKLGPA